MGFVQEPYGAPCTRIREPDTPSLSLHSSPSSVLGSLGTCSPSNPSSPVNHAEAGAQAEALDQDRKEVILCQAGEGALGAEKSHTENTGNNSGPTLKGNLDEVLPAVSPVSDGEPERNEELTEEESPYHNNNKDSESDTKERSRYRLRKGDGELLPSKALKIKCRLRDL